MLAEVLGQGSLYKAQAKSIKVDVRVKSSKTEVLYRRVPLGEQLAHIPPLDQQTDILNCLMCGRRETALHFVGACPCMSLARRHLRRIMRAYEEPMERYETVLTRILGPRGAEGALPGDDRQLVLHALLTHTGKTLRHELSLKRQAAVDALGPGERWERKYSQAWCAREVLRRFLSAVRKHIRLEFLKQREEWKRHAAAAWEEPGLAEMPEGGTTMVFGGALDWSVPEPGGEESQGWWSKRMLPEGTRVVIEGQDTDARRGRRRTGRNGTRRGMAGRDASSVDRPVDEG